MKTPQSERTEMKKFFIGLVIVIVGGLAICYAWLWWEKPE